MTGFLLCTTCMASARHEASRPVSLSRTVTKYCAHFSSTCVKRMYCVMIGQSVDHATQPRCNGSRSCELRRARFIVIISTLVQNSRLSMRPKVSTAKRLVSGLYAYAGSSLSLTSHSPPPGSYSQKESKGPTTTLHGTFEGHYTQPTHSF
jgi:hypothetical protein